MFCCVSNPDAIFDPESYYPTLSDCREDLPKTRFKPRRGRTLSERCWKASFSQEGYLDIATVIKRVQKGGVHPSIKGEVWEFLLGCYDPKSTIDQRSKLRQERRSEYDALKHKCRQMEKAVGQGKVITSPLITEDGQPVVLMHQEEANVQLTAEVIQWKLTLHQIGLDVERTDRALVFYENEANRARLWDILAIYSWTDGEIGYCQGMSDLCSPISILIENEADAFWCFEHLMQRVRGNFKSTSSTIGVRSQLSTLSSILRTVDPKLHQHIENLDGGEYLFAFRMLMVLFRREFSFVDTIYLWELMWAMEYNPQHFLEHQSRGAANGSKDAVKDESLLKQCGMFERNNLKSGKNDVQVPLSIFLVASVLELKNKQLMAEAKGLEDIVNILNGITGALDARKACKKALKVQNVYLKLIAASS